MRWSIDSSILEKHNITIEEFAILLTLARGQIPSKCIEALFNKKWIEKSIYNSDQIILPSKTIGRIKEILLDSDKLVSKRTQNNFEILANKLREIFPKGNKPGTNYSWRGNIAEITRKLKILIAKYNCQFTDEEAIEATRAYVASFNGNYQYMKLLKYFLLKTPKNNNGDVEIESEFMSYLENKESIKSSHEDWTSDLA